jgi:hypothetical protein
MISWGDIGGKRKPSRFTPVSPTYFGSIVCRVDSPKHVQRVYNLHPNVARVIFQTRPHLVHLDIL